MAPVLARLHVSTIAGQQQLHILRARRRPAIAHLPSTGSVIPLVCSSSPSFGSNGGRRLIYNAAAGAAPRGDKSAAGALDDELHKEHSIAGGSSPSHPSSRDTHTAARQAETAANDDADGVGEKKEGPAGGHQGGSKAGILGNYNGVQLEPGSGPHTNKSTQ